jgi:formamidopyrimidine-DNA glycosylase
MPELPEVETMRRGLLPVVGSRIVRAVRPPCQRRPIQFTPPFPALARSIRGKQITGIGRLGKRVLIELENGSAIVIEPRMTGLVLLLEPPTADHLRLRLELEGGTCDELLFWDRRGLGTVSLFTADEIQHDLGKRLGPDALVIRPEELQANLGSSRRPIKPALLDQHLVAGIGNLYASEILFVAKVDPRTRCDRLTRKQWSRIHTAIGEVLNDAIFHEGSTLSDGTYRNALNVQGGYQNHHRVYDRAGEMCNRCGNRQILRIVQAQRSTFFCPGCQTRRG